MKKYTREDIYNLEHILFVIELGDKYNNVYPPVILKKEPNGRIRFEVEGKQYSDIQVAEFAEMIKINEFNNIKKD